MTISTVDKLETALNSQYSKYYSVKNDPVAGNATTGGFHSFWRSTGIPGQPTIPTTTPTALNHLSTGALNFMQQTSPLTSYLAYMSALCTGAATTLEIHDRLVNMGGLSGTVATAQTITGFDLDLFLSTNNIGNRIGDSNYSDVQWWLEWYTNTGSTSVNVTVNVTYNDASTGNLTLTAIGTTIRASRMLPLNSFIPAADSGKYIRGVNSVTLSATTGTTGSFGVTATRYRSSIFLPTLNKMNSVRWAETGLPEVYNESCLFPVCMTTATTIGSIRIDGAIVHG